MNVGTSSQGNLLNVLDNIQVGSETHVEQFQSENGITTSIQVVTTDTSLNGSPLVFADTSSQDITLTLPIVEDGLSFRIKKLLL